MQLSAGLLLAAICFGLGMVGALWGTVCIYKMIAAINRGRSDDQAVSEFGFDPLKMLRIYRDYRSLYPVEKLHVQFWASNLLLFLGLIGCFVSLHFAE